ncbi:MAG: hypothetical protein PWQ25_455 [Deferribacteres bacterium]|jgi:CRISPR-associated exonuclease Cas4|nr:hypothetical protein [Deferribacteres bacterium]
MIDKILQEKLPIVLEKKSKEQFGARDFIGASDVAKCPRQFLLSKLQPEQFDTSTLIRFYRGHIAEQLLKDVFNETTYKWQDQYVAKFNEKIKATIDFIFHTKDYSKIGIVECKTVSSIPNEPYESWVQQLYFQMGIISKLFPKSEIKGCIFAFDLNSGQYKEFNEFCPNEAIFNVLLEKANTLLELWQKQDIDNAPIEKSLLCGYCQYKGDCPALSRGERYNVPSDVSAKVEKLMELLESEKEIKKLKEEIKTYMEQTGVNTIYVNASVVQYQSRKGRKTLDEKALKDAHPELDLTPFYKEGSPYSFITIK